jgi:hypothetical protein
MTQQNLNKWIIIHYTAAPLQLANSPQTLLLSVQHSNEECNSGKEKKKQKRRRHVQLRKKKRNTKRKKSYATQEEKKKQEKKALPMQLRKIKETRKEEVVEEGLCNEKRKHLEHQVRQSAPAIERKEKTKP